MTSTTTRPAKRTYLVTCPTCGAERRSPSRMANQPCPGECYDAAMAKYEADKAAYDARPKVKRERVTHVPATDGNYLAMLMGATKVRSR